MHDGTNKIRLERARQLAKGYSSENDMKYQNGELVEAVIQLLTNLVPENPIALRVYRNHGDNRLCVLAIAGALIAAEIDRLAGSPWIVTVIGGDRTSVFTVKNEQEARSKAAELIQSDLYISVSVSRDNDG